MKCLVLGMPPTPFMGQKLKLAAGKAPGFNFPEQYSMFTLWPGSSNRILALSSIIVGNW